MRRVLFFSGLLLFIPLGPIGCTGSQEALEEVDEWSTSTLASRLRREGVQLFMGTITAQPLFNVPVTEYSVSGGGTLQIFEYTSEEAARHDVTRVNDHKTRPPHFYQRQNMMVAYFGDDMWVMSALARVLGPRIG